MAHLPIAPRVKADVPNIFKPAIALQRNPVSMLEGQATWSARAMAEHPALSNKELSS